MGYFKEDMEDICDRVTIQKGSSTAYEYGQILLKSIKLLKTENVGMSTLITRASYPKYVEDTDISLLNEAGEVFILYDGDTLKNADYADGQNVYLDKTFFRDVLQEHGIEKNTEYFWLGFGGRYNV